MIKQFLYLILLSTICPLLSSASELLVDQADIQPAKNPLVVLSQQLNEDLSVQQDSTSNKKIKVVAKAKRQFKPEKVGEAVPVSTRTSIPTRPGTLPIAPPGDNTREQQQQRPQNSNPPPQRRN